MDFIDKEIENYALNHSSQENDLLKELNRQTHVQILQPRMLSGHLQGKVLSMFSYMINPKRVLEIGTYTGYSALSIAEGLAVDGEIITIDLNKELEPFTRSYFEKSDYNSKIKFLLGNALEVIPTLYETWDLVFIDADKENYSAYFDLVINQVRKGGFIIVDNVLWSGKVLHEVAPNDMETKGIIAFNSKVHADSRIENLLLPVRDGLMILRKM
ncbi:MAG: class I SAM-dependent methyltransferase [Flavobacteriales bacterium]|nr:class I SAM-dependent methyltransferase [Flavobacteriales bacterium]